MFASLLTLIPAIVSLSIAAFVLAVHEMPSYRSVNLSRVLPVGVFEQLANALQQTAQTVDQAVWVLTEATLPVEPRSVRAQSLRTKLFPIESAQLERFVVVVSPCFSGLLQAETSATPVATGTCYQVALTFAPEAIAAFLTALSSQLQHDSLFVRQLQQASEQLQANEPDMQSEFALRLTELLAATQPDAIDCPQPRLDRQLEPQQREQNMMESTQALHDALLTAQTANRTKTEFLAAMSHELRTPLTCVIGMAETLLRVMAMKPDTYTLQPQKQQEYLKLIKRSGEHLLELVNDILDVSQVEAGKVALNVRSFSVSQVAHQSLQMLHDRAQSKGIDLSLKALSITTQSFSRPESEDDSFMADPRRVSQILLNLLSNAIKFTSEGGRVTLRFGIKHDTAIFQVEDTGIGIPESQRHLLFQKFQQLDSSLTRAYEGTGLGLALTKQLVELHSGRIEVHSTVGVGSTFTVWLPAQPIAQLTAKNSSNVDAIAANPVETEITTRSLPVGGRIVLIEDHDETATLICDLLTAADCQVVWTIDASTAMRQINLLRPCLVITNMQLPDRHGHDIIQFLRQHPTLQATKILALIAEGPTDHKQGKAAADRYLTKPVQPYQLLDTVATLIGEGKS